MYLRGFRPWGRKLCYSIYLYSLIAFLMLSATSRGSSVKASMATMFIHT